MGKTGFNAPKLPFQALAVPLRHDLGGMGKKPERMRLEELQRNWDRFGRKDPMWAILTDPDKDGGRWDRESFFRTGVAEIRALFRHLHELEIPPPTGKALDFGCGIGRLSQALCTRMEEVWGVDIAPSMIDQARQWNQYGERCHYVLNERDDLSVFGDRTFDLIYSNITLQHMAPAYARAYIREFLRLLAPGGVLVFQLPARVRGESLSRWEKWRGRARTAMGPALSGALDRLLIALRKAKGQPVMEMHGHDPMAIREILEAPGYHLVDLRENSHAGARWVSYLYTVRRRNETDLPTDGIPEGS